MELVKAVDSLSLVSLKTETESERQQKIKLLRTVDDQLSLPSLQYVSLSAFFSSPRLPFFI
jgi:hypothetical protein